MGGRRRGAGDNLSCCLDKVNLPIAALRAPSRLLVRAMRRLHALCDLCRATRECLAICYYKTSSQPAKRGPWLANVMMQLLSAVPERCHATEQHFGAELNADGARALLILLDRSGPDRGLIVE